MGKMRALAPRMTKLRETYKDDREKLNRATMELYQREKVNPLAGCLPMVIQIPVFLAWYWVLRDSVELRQAPFMLWINDLSARDPFFVLPAIMAGAMFVQSKLTPQVGDPAQQKLFAFMPLAMSATFAFFPAGLVLYWVTNTVLSILQQWNINRRLEVAGAREALNCAARIAHRRRADDYRGDGDAAGTRWYRDRRARSGPRSAAPPRLGDARAHAAAALPSPRRPAFPYAAGHALDHGLALYFPAPHSYTGEAGAGAARSRRSGAWSSADSPGARTGRTTCATRGSSPSAPT